MRRETSEPMDVTLHGNGPTMEMMEAKKKKKERALADDAANIARAESKGEEVLPKSAFKDEIAERERDILRAQMGRKKLAETPIEEAFFGGEANEVLPPRPGQRDEIAERERDILEKQQERQKRKVKADIAIDERMKAARAGIREQKREEFERKVDTIAAGVKKGAEASVTRKKRVTEDQAAWVQALEEQRTVARARRTVTAAEAPEPVAPPEPPPAPRAQPKKKKGFFGWVNNLFGG